MRRVLAGLALTVSLMAGGHAPPADAATVAFAGEITFLGSISSIGTTWNLSAALCQDADVSSEPFHAGLLGGCSLWMSGGMDGDLCSATAGWGTGQLWAASGHVYSLSVSWLRSARKYVVTGTIGRTSLPYAAGPITIVIQSAATVFTPCTSESSLGTGTWAGGTL